MISVEKDPKNLESEEKAPPVVEQISLPPITEAQKRDLLDQLDRLLAFALREEGLHLWNMRNLYGQFDSW